VDVQQELFSQQELFIANRWVKPSAGRRIEVISPSTEEVIGSVPVAEAREIDEAVAAARSAFDSGPWPRMTVAERAEALTRVVDAWEPHANKAVEVQIAEMGGPRKFLEAATHILRYWLANEVREAGNINFREVRQGQVGDVVVLREPIGVVAAIIPWNSPIQQAWSKLVSSLLMGCPIILKTAPESPLSMELLANAFEAADLPPGTVSLISGGGDTGEYLVRHPDVDKVTFTGSTATGGKIAAICGELIRPVNLELGGKSAAILLDDDIGNYLPSLIANSLSNSGQICISTNRVLVPEAHYDSIVDHLVDYVAALKVGSPYDPDTDIGPLVAERQRSRVESYIASGKEQGAKIVLGGGRPTDLRGWYVEPTIFVDVDNKMRIAQEEIFGPVLSVIKYRDVDNAVAIANDSDYGLYGAVFSRDPEYALEVASRVRTGTLAVNDGPPIGGGGPFGGYKRSGLGRELSHEGLESHLEYKSIALPPSVSAPEGQA